MGSLASVLIVFSFFFTPLIWLAGFNFSIFIKNDPDMAKILFTPPFQKGYLPAKDAEAISAAIKADIQPGDFVVGPGTVTWMLPVQTADIRNVLLYEKGGNMVNIPGFDPARFILPQAMDNAKFVIVDDSWRGWSDASPEIVAESLQKVSQWPLKMVSGSLQLFCNPKYCR